MFFFAFLFALGGDLGVAAFLKDVSSEIVVFEGKASKKASERESQRGSKNRPRKIHEKVSFWGSVLAPPGASWATLGPILGHFVAALPLLGPRGPKREAQEQPKSAQETPKSCPREAKRGP